MWSLLTCSFWFKPLFLYHYSCTPAAVAVRPVIQVFLYQCSYTKKSRTPDYMDFNFGNVEDKPCPVWEESIEDFAAKRRFLRRVLKSVDNNPLDSTCTTLNPTENELIGYKA